MIPFPAVHMVMITDKERIVAQGLHMDIIQYGLYRPFIRTGDDQKYAVHHGFNLKGQMLYQCQEKQKKRKEGQYDKIGRIGLNMLQSDLSLFFLIYFEPRQSIEAL